MKQELSISARAWQEALAQAMAAGWCVRVDKRLKPGHGLTDFDSKTIRLPHGQHGDDRAEMLAHELAHVKAGPRSAHGKAWCCWARRLGCDTTDIMVHGWKR